MITRALVSRLERLERRVGTSREPLRFIIRYINPDGTVASTVRLGEGGEREWWSASGQGSQDANNQRGRGSQFPGDT
jgi:hypothetical protein